VQAVGQGRPFRHLALVLCGELFLPVVGRASGGDWAPVWEEVHRKLPRRTGQPTSGHMEDFAAVAVRGPHCHAVRVPHRGVCAVWLPRSVDLQRYRPGEVSISPAETSAAVVHNRGLEELYNIPCTLKAFGLVQQRYPEACLTVAHDGPLRTQLEEKVRELGLRRVRFVGTVPQGDVPAQYDAADIYLTSPNIDNMPGSLLECYASGLPVVATKAGGIPYIARNEETALLVDLDDHEAMARAALRLIEEDGLAERLATAAREQCQRYSGPAVRQAWLALYEELHPTND